MSSLSLPPGYSPPSTVLSDSDHGGWLTITIGVMLCNVLLFLAVRLYIRFAISPPFRRDDATFCLATVRPRILVTNQDLQRTGLLCDSVRLRLSLRLQWVREIKRVDSIRRSCAHSEGMQCS